MGLRQLFSRRPADEAHESAIVDPNLRFLTRITRELGQGPLNLPCFPDVVPRVRRALDDPRSTADDIVRIAGSEPRLAARLIQTASSVVFNPSGKPAPNLRAAVTRLGHHLVQSVAMVFAMQQAKADPALRPVAAQLAGVWEKSVAVASICKVLAERLKVPADKVFLAGLVHGIGHFYLLVRSAEPTSGVASGELPRGLVDEWHPMLGREVLRKWNFEEGICEAVAHQHDYLRESEKAADLTDVLIAGVVLAEALLERGGDLSRCEGITAFSRLGLEAADLQAVLAHTQHSLGSLRDVLAA